MKTSLILTTSIILLATVGLAQGNGNGSSNGNQPPSNFWATGGNANTDSTNFIGSTDDQDVIIKTNNQESMRILSNGNIGIGSDSPIQKLHVEGDAVVNNGKFKLTGANGFGGPQIIFGGTPSENGDWSIEYREFATVKGLNFWKPWPSANSGNAKFFIADNGKVGIATGNPLAKLDVNGNIRIADGTQGANKVLVSNANGIAKWKNLSDITTASNGVYTSLNATDYLKVGNASLYITAPNATPTGGIITNATAHEMFTTGQDLWIQSNASSGSANTIINGNTVGNVGIGTTNPVAKLHVNGNVLVAAGNYLRFGTEDVNTGYLAISNSSCCYNNYADIKGSLYFRNTNNGYGNVESVAMGIQSDGTVTIGVWEKYDNSITDTDGHKLMVNGGILCEKVKVIEDVPNSDHVFESDYDLKSIEEVKTFIEENKHLPEVPSAEEFKENGYSVGEMDDLLLRKVEELTLYIIQLEEEIQELKAENN